MSRTAVRVGLVFPTLLGTYGDRGNAVVLVERARRRGYAAELVDVAAGTPVPDSLDVYVLGGGEDEQQVMASDGLRASSGALTRARDTGAVVFAVCAGYQLLGHRYETGAGVTLDGLGLADMTTTGGPDRLIGEVVVDADPALGIDALSGFENHSGRTTLGRDARPLGTVRVGGGNGDGHDGVLAPRLVGTYLHGPVLARNPALADLLLRWATGADTLSPLDDARPHALARERIAAATATGWRARVRDWRLAHG